MPPAIGSRSCSAYRFAFGEIPDGLGLRAGMSVKVSIDTGYRRSLHELWRDITSIFGA
jgi:membrane fusion protein, multidrug efflux system